MRPHVILNSAMSLDGVIGEKDRRVVLSNKQDLQRVYILRRSVDAIMVGINTILTDNPSLTTHGLSKKNPIRVIVDSMARIPIKSRILNRDAPTIIVVSKKAPIKKIQMLRNKDVDVIVSGNKKVNLKKLLSELYKCGIHKLLLEGGGTLNKSMLENGLVDEIYITIAPRLLGSGIHFINGKLAREVKLNLIGVKKIQEQILLHYTVK